MGRVSLGSGKYNTVVLVSLLSRVFFLLNSELLEDRDNVLIILSLYPTQCLAQRRPLNECVTSFRIKKCQKPDTALCLTGFSLCIVAQSTFWAEVTVGWGGILYRKHKT